MVNLLDVYDDLNDYSDHIRDLNERACNSTYNPKAINISRLFVSNKTERIIYVIQIAFPESSRVKVKKALKVLKESVGAYHQLRDYNNEGLD